MSRSTARGLAAGAIAAQVLFVIAWIVAGALDPGYSHIEEGVSALGADDAKNPLIVNAAIVLLGLSIAAVGVALTAVVPRRPARTVAVALFAAAGVVTAAAGFLPVDCSFAVGSCEDAWRAGDLSWQTYAHEWLGLAGALSVALLPFGIAAALRPGPVSTVCLGIGWWSLVFLAVSTVFGFADIGGYGAGQRVGLFLIHVWIVLVAGGVLYATRRAPEPGRLVPLRPRDFVAAEWRGEGELSLRPLWFWGRFAQRFAARRTTTWLTDRVFRIDDESRFGDGRSQRRTMYCEFGDDDVVRITAGDLPEGAEIRFEDAGYRMVPWRMHFPLGPLPLIVRCRDESWVDEATFVNVTEVETVIFRIPLARLTFRVRPVVRENGDDRELSASAA